MKTLIEEGITKVFLKSFELKESFSPVQLRPHEEPVRLVPCSKGFWVLLADNSYLKNENKSLMVIPEKEAKIGRARYLLNFQDQILEDKIQGVVKKIKLDLEEKTKNVLRIMRDRLIYAEMIKPEGLEAMVLSMKKSSPTVAFTREILNAKVAIDEAYHNLYDKICIYQETQDFERLFVLLEQDGSPMIATFNKDNSAEMEVMKQYFSASNLAETMEEKRIKGHIYQFAKFKILTQTL